MPSDITGTEVIQEDKASGVRQFKFLRGPVFANIVLADEINRTPPKTQAALLEAMQERQVTVGGERHKLPDPFFVLATQNPIEQEGTYPLPEAQLDRFMLNIMVGYPTEEEELDIVRMTTSVLRPMVSKVLSGTDILVASRAGAEGADRRPRFAICGAADPQHPPRRGQRSEFHSRLRELGRRPPRQPVPGAGGQGPRRLARRPITSRPMTFGRSPGRCCGTGSSPTSTPKPRDSSPTTSSSG